MVIPAGGTTGQVLTKNSGTDYDTGWQDAATVLAINSQIANYVLVLSDEQKLVAMNVATANTLTVPPASSVAWTVGTMVHLYQAGDGQTTITPGLGVTISASPGLKTRAKFSAATLVYLGSDAWLAVGDLAA